MRPCGRGPLRTRRSARMPLSRVSANRSSSPRTASSMRTRSLTSSGIRRAHHVADPGHGLPEERLGEAEHAAVTHGPAHDPAQDVAAPLVGGHHAVGDEEGGGAPVVGDDAHGDVVVRVAPGTLAGQLAHPRDERREQVGLPAGELALHDRGDALQTHAGVDGRPRQRRHAPAGVAVELHEHEVPDLEPAVALAGRPLARPPGRLLGARQVVALVEMDLRAGAARPGVAHRPEVVLLAQAQDAVVLQPGDLLPQGEGVVVVRVDRGDEPAGVDAELAGEELPGEGDRVGLEVVAEREVAEHLEERVVAGRPAHVLEVVVLAARPHALLTGRGPDVVAPLLAQEHALELHHAGVGEQQGGVVTGHERGGPHPGVALALEVLEKGLRGSHYRS